MLTKGTEQASPRPSAGPGQQLKGSPPPHAPTLT